MENYKAFVKKNIKSFGKKLASKALPEAFAHQLHILWLFCLFFVYALLVTTIAFVSLTIFFGEGVNDIIIEFYEGA